MNLRGSYFVVGLMLGVLSACQDAPQNHKQNWTTIFETSQGKETATYPQVIDYYRQLSTHFEQISLHQGDTTDSGEPLHLVIYQPKGSPRIEMNKRPEIPVVLVNNGIHPGESDGIDASMMLLRDWALYPENGPKDFAVAVIPVYNIGGALNRNSTTRTNQNGPVSYGFRGNAKNYDLNRDFIKADTKNALAFSHLFHWLDPIVFVDNHVSNGADYQYTLTHLMTQHNKLDGALGQFMQSVFTPELEQVLAQNNWPITPYVNVFNRSPETGFTQFMDHPRYSTGYTTLFQTLGMMVETHMLKPYQDRVNGTYALMQNLVNLCQNHLEEIVNNKAHDRQLYHSGDHYPLNWQVDRTESRPIEFKGYAAQYLQSEITGKQRLSYDRTAPYTKTIPYFDTYLAQDSVLIPEHYGIPRAFDRVIERLKANDISLIELPEGLKVNAEIYHIKDYQSAQNPYEGHYLHYNTQVTSSSETVVLKAGDFLVPTDQPGVRYLLETLEPQAVDSFFNWNFFDIILQQKEGFSPYVWEDLAKQILERDPVLQAAFEQQKAQDPDFAQNAYAQLDWLHKHSVHYEKAHLRYPIVRVLDQIVLGKD